jgi:hypothetical protein
MGVMYGRINQYNKAKIYYQKSIEKSSKTNYLLSALVLIHFSKRPQCQPTKDSPAYLRLKSDKSASIQ